MEIQTKYGFVTDSDRSILMSKIKSKNTKPERILRKSLWNNGLRYRINNNYLPGKPDIVFLSKKLVIFIDGEFWHGYNWHLKKIKIKTNREYWINKIERNIARDQRINELYFQMNWKVIRFWSHDIKKNIDICVKTITNSIEKDYASHNS